MVDIRSNVIRCHKQIHLQWVFCEAHLQVTNRESKERAKEIGISQRLSLSNVQCFCPAAGRIVTNTEKDTLRI